MRCAGSLESVAEKPGDPPPPATQEAHAWPGGTPGPQATYGPSLTFALQQNFNHSVLSATEIAALRTADPAAADLLYRMIERQQVHDNHMERATLRSESLYRLTGMGTALSVVLALSALAAFAIYMGHPRTGVFFGAAAGLSTLAGVFIRGRGLATPAGSVPSGANSPGSPEQIRPTHPPRPPGL